MSRRLKNFTLNEEAYFVGWFVVTIIRRDILDVGCSHSSDGENIGRVTTLIMPLVDSLEEFRSGCV